MIGHRLIEPYLFEENLTAARYLDFLRFDLFPAFAVMFSNHEDGDVPHQRIWFQQDGAFLHFGLEVRRFLDIFEGCWIGRRGSFEWPARSPDLTLLDFFLWGYLKSRVYINSPNNLKNLKEKIRIEMANITPDIIERAIQGVYIRAVPVNVKWLVDGSLNIYDKFC